MANIIQDARMLAGRCIPGAVTRPPSVHRTIAHPPRYVSPTSTSMWTLTAAAPRRGVHGCYPAQHVERHSRLRVSAWLPSGRVWSQRRSGPSRPGLLPLRYDVAGCTRSIPRGVTTHCSDAEQQPPLDTWHTSAAKDHKSSLCLVPPPAAWHPIQRVRCFLDKGFVRWPPHVNLLYPFLEDSIASPQPSGGTDSLQRAASIARAALEGTEPFDLTLDTLGIFDHGSSCTVYLGPRDPHNELAQLQATLLAAFPQCSDLSEDPRRGIARFVPHMSVAQCPSRARAEATIAAIEAEAWWGPLMFTVDRVALLSRRGFKAPFAVRFLVPLGSSAGLADSAGGSEVPPRLDWPYVPEVPYHARATVDPAGGGALWPRCGAGGGFRCIGTAAGDLRGGVWNFAYGANINRRKLESTRALSPLESKPGVLRGFTLKFNHRGGFGNVEESGEAGGVETPSPGEQGGGGGECRDVHGVLHRLSVDDMGSLMNMEHEYLPVEVDVEAYDGTRVTAVVFRSPPERVTRGGLPPVARYLGLLQEGAREWALDPQYCAWLDGLASTSDRGDAYYSSPDGGKLAPWPKLRTGSERRKRSNRSRRKNAKGKGRAK